MWKMEVRNSKALGAVCNIVDLVRALNIAAEYISAGNKIAHLLQEGIKKANSPEN